MAFTGTLPLMMYSCPEEKDAVRATEMTDLQAVKTRLRVLMFGYTDQEMSDLAAAAATHCGNGKWLLDHVQETGHVESALVHRLALQVGAQNIGIRSSVFGQFSHQKIVVADNVVWTGSLNWSITAYRQDQEVFRIEDAGFADYVCAKIFDPKWADTFAREPQYQNLKAA